MPQCEAVYDNGVSGFYPCFSHHNHLLRLNTVGMACRYRHLFRMSTVQHLPISIEPTDNQINLVGAMGQCSVLLFSRYNTVFHQLECPPALYSVWKRNLWILLWAAPEWKTHSHLQPRPAGVPARTIRRGHSPIRFLPFMEEIELASLRLPLILIACHATDFILSILAVRFHHQFQRLLSSSFLYFFFHHHRHTW